MLKSTDLVNNNFIFVKLKIYTYKENTHERVEHHEQKD